MLKNLLNVFLFLFFIGAAQAQQSKAIQFREEAFDFGLVNEEAGAAEHEFVFTNASGRPIKILSVQASCGCTTPGWSKESVAPGKTGHIQASFNPKGRPGYFNKTLNVTTDLDPTPITLQIKGQVVSGNAKPAETEFQISNGSWKFKTASFNMGKVYLKDESVTREFIFVNSSTKPVTYQDKFISPKYLKAEITPKTIAPGQRGTVKVIYNGKMKNAYGFQSDNIQLQTDDEKEPLKSFSVYATLEDFFTPLSPEEASKAPQLNLSSTNVDFGRVKQNASASRTLSFTNTGKKELTIKSLQGNCSCLSVSSSKPSFKPGESGTISITFNPHDRKGTQTKAITIYSNDPQNSVQRITLSAYIED